MINEKRRNNARANVKKGRTPYDLRYKKTRAFRRRLTKHELSLKTLRTQKKENNFRQRKFALAA